METKFEVILQRKPTLIKNIKISAKSSIEKQLLQRDHHNNRNENIFVYIGMSDDDNIYGKVPKIGKCTNTLCTGICSNEKKDRMIIVEWVKNNEITTSWALSHEIGHLMGMSHDFAGSRSYPYSKMSRRGTDCYNNSGIMDFHKQDNKNLKWTQCSVEASRKYHKDAKNIDDENAFCLEKRILKLTKIVDVGKSMKLSCDMKQCPKNEIYYITWSYRSRSDTSYTEIGTIYPNEHQDISNKPSLFRSHIIMEYLGLSVDLIVPNMTHDYIGEYYCEVHPYDDEPTFEHTPYCEVDSVKTNVVIRMTTPTIIHSQETNSKIIDLADLRNSLWVGIFRF